MYQLQKFILIDTWSTGCGISSGHSFVSSPKINFHAQVLLFLDSVRF